MTLPPPKRVEIGAFYSVFGDHGILRSVAIHDQANSRTISRQRTGRGYGRKRQATKDESGIGESFESKSQNYPMTDSGGMFSKLINPNTAKPAEPQKPESKAEG